MQEKIKSIADHLPHIGMRKVKTLISVFVGFLVWQLIRLLVPQLEVHPTYIYMYCILEIRDSSEKTVNFGKRRIKATITAMCVGLPLLFLSVWLKSFTALEWLHTVIEFSVVLVGTLIAISVADRVGCKNFCGVAATTLMILIISHSDGEPFTYAILRSTQTIIAVFIAWVINVKLFPYTKTEEEQKTIKNT